MITVRIDENTQRKLAALAASVTGTQVRQAFRGAAREVALAERAESPRDKGSLIRAINWFLLRKKQPEAFAKIDSKRAPHANLVMYGTRSRRVAGSRFLAFQPKRKRKLLFRKSVAPMPANPFWFRVAGRVIQSVGDRLVSVLQSAVGSEVKRA